MPERLGMGVKEEDAYGLLGLNQALHFQERGDHMKWDGVAAAGVGIDGDAMVTSG
ncbi:hypothetical protein ACFFLM_23665 [Deinococcus oregonensis]|uniref:Uncharacterized protein n=1 Tax=Deinococcus oregonensis TaxID=1805970 RepID=A0ABV6B5B9_9DEIO